MCVHVRQKQELAIEKKNDRVESAPSDVYGLENLTTVYLKFLINRLVSREA